MAEKLTVGSLFAGIGGFDLAAERVGFEVKWQVEIDEYCNRVLEKHWPRVHRVRDIREAYGYCGEYLRGPKCLMPVDVICGGFPCKQTSVAAAITRRRVGLAGADSGLWRQMLRIVREVRPRFAVVENPESDALTQVSRDLEELGGAISRHPFTVAGFGGPHLRRRVFVVADFDGSGLAESRQDGSPEIEGFAWPSAERNPWMQTLGRVQRVDDGVPGGLDRRERIQACGNAVIPQAAEWIFSRIKEAEGLTA